MALSTAMIRLVFIGAVFLLFSFEVEAGMTGQRFTCSKPGNFGDPENCRKYYFCRYSHEHSQYIAGCGYCPPSMLYNEGYNACGYIVPGVAVPEDCERILYDELGICNDSEFPESD